MRALLLLLVTIAMSIALDAHCYVSPAGRDEWSGRLPAPSVDGRDGPFRSLARAAAAVQPGEICCLRQGVWRETLTPPRDGEPGRPITFRAFPGETPLISGADPVDGWIREADGVLSAPMDWDLGDGDQVFRDGEPLDEARWPANAGTLFQPTRAAAASGDAGSLHDPALPADRDWTGAILWCAGGDRWVCWSETVTGFDPASRTLRFTMASPEHWYTVRPGSPYVLIGARAALAPGQWCHDRARRRLLLLTRDGGAPQAIEAKRRQHCLDLAGRAHIVLDGIAFRAGGVRTDAASHDLTLLRCHGRWVAHAWRGEPGNDYGVLIRGRSNAVIDCDLAGSSTSVLSVEGTDHRIVNCAISEGGYAGRWLGAVRLSGRRIVFSHNIVRHAGRDLVSIHGLMESLIQHNDLSDAGWLTCDLGMLYGHNTDFMNTVIRRNHVHGNHAAGCAMGIYFDHCSHNAIVADNAVWGVRDDPIRINNPSHFSLVLRNTCRGGAISTFDHSHRDDLFGVRFAGNALSAPLGLPAHVVQEGNSVGDVPDGPPSWPAGRIPGAAPTVAWEPADVPWMNALRNACFELPTLEGWRAEGAAELVPGNGWGNPVHGSRSAENTGTSQRELRLGPGGARVGQEIAGLHDGAAHTLSGWLRTAGATATARLGVRLPDGTVRWTDPVAGPAWTRVLVVFTAGAGAHTVLVEQAGDGHAWCDNLGLPRTPAAGAR